MQERLDQASCTLDDQPVQAAPSKAIGPESVTQLTRLGENPRVETLSLEAGMHVVASDDCSPLVEGQYAPETGPSRGWLDGHPKEASVSSPIHVRINWNAPVYLWHGRVLRRLRRPLPRLFRLAQIRDAMDRQQTLLASVMLAVLGTKGQCKSRDARYQAEYWRLKMRLLDLPQGQIVQEAAQFIPESLLSRLLPTATHDMSVAPPTPLAAGQQGGTPQHSPLTPELPSDLLLPLARTPDLDEEDEETHRMQAEIDNIVQRTPAIQDTPSKRPQARLLDKALTVIKDTSLFGRNRHRVRGESHGAGLEGGSAYLYAMITPSKRLRGLLDTDVAVSPVRRSRRLLGRDATPKKDLYNKIDDIPDISSMGYVPNSHVDGVLHPKRKLFRTSDSGDTVGHDHGRDREEQENSP